MGREIISVVERRRRWPDDTKLQIMTEALAPGALVSQVASRHGVSRSQIYTWLRLARANRLSGIAMAPEPAASFVPVRIEEPGKSPSPDLQVAAPHATGPACPPPGRHRRASIIEVGLRNGRSLKADEGIDPAVLARLATALDREAP